MEKILEKFQNFGGLSTKDKVVVGGSLGMPHSTTPLTRTHASDAVNNAYLLLLFTSFGMRRIVGVDKPSVWN